MFVNQSLFEAATLMVAGSCLQVGDANIALFLGNPFGLVRTNFYKHVRHIGAKGVVVSHL